MDIYDKLKIYCTVHPFMKMLFACISNITRFTTNIALTCHLQKDDT